MKLCKTTMQFILEHSYMEVLEYYIDNPAKSRNIYVRSICMCVYVSTFTLEPAKRKDRKLPMAVLHCPSNMHSMEETPN